MRLRWLAILCGLSLMACAAAASHAEADGLRSQPSATSWTFGKPVQLSPQSRKVTVTYLAGGCVALDHVEVRRARRTITVTVYITYALSSDGYALPCPAPIPTRTTVDLQGRLGHRTVLDSRDHDIQTDFADLHTFAPRVTFDRRIPLDWFGLRTVRIASFERVGHGTVLAHIAKQFSPYPSYAGPLPAPIYAVPAFVGQTLSAAAAWADEHNLRWTANTPPRLKRATAGQLLDNYRITAQSPPAGSQLQADPNTPVTLTVKTR